MREDDNRVDLVDIRDFAVDRTLPKQERIADYIRQIKDPYCFRCGEFTVKVRFAQDGMTLEDCFQRIVTS